MDYGCLGVGKTLDIDCSEIRNYNKSRVGILAVTGGITAYTHSVHSDFYDVIVVNCEMFCEAWNFCGNSAFNAIFVYGYIAF